MTAPVIDHDVTAHQGDDLSCLGCDDSLSDVGRLALAVDRLAGELASTRAELHDRLADQRDQLDQLAADAEGVRRVVEQVGPALAGLADSPVARMLGVAGGSGIGFGD